MGGGGARFSGRRGVAAMSAVLGNDALGAGGGSSPGRSGAIPGTATPSTVFDPSSRADRFCGGGAGSVGEAGDAIPPSIVLFIELIPPGAAEGFAAGANGGDCPAGGIPGITPPSIVPLREAIPPGAGAAGAAAAGTGVDVGGAAMAGVTPPSIVLLKDCGGPAAGTGAGVAGDGAPPNPSIVCLSIPAAPTAGAAAGAGAAGRAG